MLCRGLTATFAVLALVVAAAPASAQDATAVQLPAQAAPPGYPALPLLSTGTTVLGEPLRYPGGAAHVTSAIVTLAPGERTILHKHGVPMFFYILDGEITVDYGTRGRRTYQKGQSQIEAMGVAHFGENNGKEPMRLIAVYMGASSAKNVIPVK